jgi:2-amino-4-hydroxy-6-hydroxymethyldihydropteridine diphosphokinase
MPDFLNAVVLIRAEMAVGSLLRHLKYIERRAGRRVRARWSARPLDIDIIDHGGRVMNWPVPTLPGGPLVLPHPLMHVRGFVLAPLAEVAPWWRHPVLGLTAEEMLDRNPGLRRGVVPVSPPPAWPTQRGAPPA